MAIRLENESENMTNFLRVDRRIIIQLQESKYLCQHKMALKKQNWFKNLFPYYNYNNTKQWYKAPAKNRKDQCGADSGFVEFHSRSYNLQDEPLWMTAIAENINIKTALCSQIISRTNSEIQFEICILHQKHCSWSLFSRWQQHWRFTLSQTVHSWYHRTSNIGAMFTELNWESQASLPCAAHLVFLYKIHHELVNIPLELKHHSAPTHNENFLTYNIPASRTGL